MTKAMAAEDPSAIDNEMLRSFRQFADEQGEDRQALAAFSAGPSPPLDRDALAHLPMPVLVVAGQRDDLAGPPEPLARSSPWARASACPGSTTSRRSRTPR